MVLQALCLVPSSMPLTTEMMGTDLDLPITDCQTTVAACHGGNKIIQAELSSSYTHTYFHSIKVSIPCVTFPTKGLPNFFVNVMSQSNRNISILLVIP